MQRYDKYWIGVVIGLILPALFVYIYLDRFNLWYSFRLFGAELRFSWCKLLLISVFPNFALMFVAYAADLWKLSKGMLIGAAPYLVASMAVLI